jgi:amino acid adenylation domain-containing protein
MLVQVLVKSASGVLVFPLSPQQEIVWLHREMAPKSAAYHFVTVAKIKGNLVRDRLVASIEAVVAHHPGMRLELCGEGPGQLGKPSQRIVADVSILFQECDLRGIAGKDAVLAELLAQQAALPFDLGAAPLARWLLVRLENDYYHLVHTEHHLIHDGRSFSLFLRDLFSTYEALGRGVVLELEPSIGYDEYVSYCASEKFRGQVEKDLVWWRQELAGADVNATFRGFLRSTGESRDYSGSQWRHPLPPALATALRRRAEEGGHTLFSVLFGLFGELLRRHAGQDDIIIGTASANRSRRFDRMIGMLINSIPVRVIHDAEWTGHQLVNVAMDNLFAAMDHQAASIQEIVRATGASSSQFDTPLFRVMFSAHDSALPATELPGLDVEFVEAINLSTSRGFDIDVVVLPGKRSIKADEQDDITVVWDYSTQHFDPASIELLACRYERLLWSYVDAPGDPVRSLSMTGPDDQAVLWSEPPAARVAPRGVAARIREVAATEPEHVAVIAGVHSLTYHALIQRVDRCAASLRALELERGDVVASALPRGLDPVVLLLACLELELVFAPVTAAAPAAHIAMVLDGLGARLLLVAPDRLAELSDVRVARATMDGISSVVLPTAPRREPVAAAYVIHTSGSTGVPKRVAVPVSALERAVDAAVQSFHLVRADRVLQFTNPAFDVFFEEVLPALVVGATLVIPRGTLTAGQDLAALVLARRLTVVNLPTSYVANVIDAVEELLGDRDHALRLVVLGGERLSTELADRVAALLPRGQMVNAYGVTEATITSTVHRHRSDDDSDDDADDAREVPVGRPLPGVAVRVVADATTAAPIGVPGEIALAGSGDSPWYLDDPKRTAEWFGPLDGSGTRFYRTGDLAFWGADGNLRFLGRRDRQVKLRGHRIELEEIEFLTRRVLRDVECAVVLDTLSSPPRLVGFVENTDDGIAQAARRDVAALLAPAVAPSAWVALAALPRRAGDKIDYAALQRLASTVDGRRSGATPFDRRLHTEDTPLLHVVLNAYRRILDQPAFGPDDDFFVAGGHSLLVALLVSGLANALGSRPPMRAVFDCPSPRQLAEWLAERDMLTATSAAKARS